MIRGKISPIEIGFDFDGVIANTPDVFIRICCEKYGYCDFTKEDITNFELQDCVDMPLEIVEEIFTAIMLDSLATGVKPFEGAVEVISSLAAENTVNIITARPDARPLIAWIHNFFPDDIHHNLHVTATGDHDDKLRYIKEKGLRFFIDDRIATCRQLAEGGITPIVYTQPWNRGQHSFQTVKNWDEINTLFKAGKYNNDTTKKTA